MNFKHKLKNTNQVTDYICVSVRIILLKFQNIYFFNGVESFQIDIIDTKYKTTQYETFFNEDKFSSI